MSRTQSPPVAASRAQLRLERILLAVGVAALGFNLRGAITSLPPVYPELQARLHLSAAAVSLLAATPVIVFGLVSGFAAALARWAGEERVLLGAAVVLTVGLVARGAAPAALLFPGTIAASGAIAVMNVLLSSMIKRRWPERAGLLIGIYITALSAGSIVGSLVSVPLWQGSGGSVALTLGWLAAPAAVAVLLWLPQARAGLRPAPAAAQAGEHTAPHDTAPHDTGPHDTGRPDAGLPDPVPPRVAVYRHALAWHVTLFMGLQSLLYYAALSWLPTMLRGRGDSAATAGDLLALMGVGNLAVSMFVPMAAQRMRSQHVLVVPTVAALGVGLAGLLYAPLGGAVVWALVLGAGQNAALALGIFFTAHRAPDPVTAASLSALAQAVGYLLASAGPLEVGLLHSATDSWTAPVIVLFAFTVAAMVFGILAARSRTLPAATSGGHAPEGHA